MIISQIPGQATSEFDTNSM